MPESPVFLLAKGKDKEAKQSLQWLRGNEYNTTEEMEQVTRQCQVETEVSLIMSSPSLDKGKC